MRRLVGRELEVAAGESVGQAGGEPLSRVDEPEGEGDSPEGRYAHDPPHRAPWGRIVDRPAHGAGRAAEWRQEGVAHGRRAAQHRSRAPLARARLPRRRGGSGEGEREDGQDNRQRGLSHVRPSTPHAEAVSRFVVSSVTANDHERCWMGAVSRTGPRPATPAPAALAPTPPTAVPSPTPPTRYPAPTTLTSNTAPARPRPCTCASAFSPGTAPPRRHLVGEEPSRVA